MSKSTNVDIMWQIMLSLKDKELDEAISNCLEFIQDEYNIGGTSLWFHDIEDKRISSIFNTGNCDSSGYNVDDSSGILGDVITGKESVIVNDTDKDKRFVRGKEEITGIKASNMVCVPMKFMRKVVGCLMLVNKTGLDENPEDFTEEEAATFTSIAAIMAMVMDEQGYVYKIDKDRKVLMSLKNITKDFPSGMDIIHVLKGINLDIYENEFLVFLGESGCGKTTMLNIIGGIDSMTSGEMSLGDKDFSKPTEKELTEYRRDMIGYIFQSYNLMPNLTAIENVEFVAEICKDSGDSEEAIKMVGLGEKKGHYPSMMSGGQQQRVSIARAIVKHPKIILADEPTAALDFNTGQEILKVIEDLVKNKVATVIMVTHNVEIAKMANRVVKLKDGRISSIRMNAWPLSAEDLVW